jgi:predicted nucleotidyltransferase
VKEIKEFMYNKNPMLILSYLTKSKNNKNVYGSQIANELEISQSGTSRILKYFGEIGIVYSESVGKTLIYKTNFENPVVKSFRRLDNLLELNGLINLLKNYTRKVILFGSCSKGEDSHESDIDLFVIADEDNKDYVRQQISEYKIDRTINPIIVDTIELMELEENDKVFYREIYNGIELWGGNIE